MLLLAAALLIHNVTVIDPAARSVRVADVCVDGERIAGKCDNATVINGTGKFLIPGLADMHAHLFEHGRDDKGNIRPRFDRPTLEQTLRAFLDVGVRTIRDPGAETEAAVTIQNMVAKGVLAGPDITTCGRILNSSNFDPEPFQLVAGTDMPTPWIIPGVSLHDELRLLREAGIPAMDVLRIATRTAIKPGAPANLVLLAKNPLDDIQNTRTIVCVIKRGQIVMPREQPPAPRPLPPAP